MSFSLAHAYVLNVLDTHSCHVSEYVHEFTQSSDIADDDICQIHHLFHIAFIIPDINLILTHKNFYENPQTIDNIYDYNSYDNFLKPPINI